MRRAGMFARTITLHLRFADFSDLSRSVTLPTPVNPTTAVYQGPWSFGAASAPAAGPHPPGRGTPGGLVDASQAAWQPTLDAPERGWREADQAADAAIARFGPQAVRRARLTDRRPGSGSDAPAGRVH